MAILTEMYFSHHLAGMLYEYDQTVLQPKTGKHFNFHLVRGKTTGAYVFGNTPQLHRKIMEKILHKMVKTFAFLDDFLSVTKGQKEDHLNVVEDTIKSLDER